MRYAFDESSVENDGQESEPVDGGVFQDESNWLLLSSILGHPQKSASIPELSFMNPSLSESDIRECATELVSEGVLDEVRFSDSRGSDSLPKIFYEVSDMGWRLVESGGMNAYIDRWESIYHVTWKPDEILQIEEMRRP